MDFLANVKIVKMEIDAIVERDTIDGNEHI